MTPQTFIKNLHADNVYAEHGYFGDLTASSTITAKQLCAQNPTVRRFASSPTSSVPCSTQEARSLARTRTWQRLDYSVTVLTTGPRGWRGIGEIGCTTCGRS